MAIAAPPIVSPRARMLPGSRPSFRPHRDPAELTIRALLLGAVLGVVFAASSVYLALKIGLTVSASIPIAVLAVAFFRTLGHSTILENNIVQTTGSAGESIAAGVVFTLPAILLMGYDLSIAKVGIIAAVGGDPRHPADDPAAARAHREGAQDPHVSRGHGLRRGAHRRREGRAAGEAAVPGVRARLRLQVPDGRAQDCGRRLPPSSFGFFKRRHGVGRGVARTAGRGLHHRAAHRRAISSPVARSPTSCSCRRSSSSARD